MENKKEKYITTKILQSTHNRLVEYKKENGVNIAFAINEAVNNYFEKNKAKKVNIENNETITE